jgi:light-regulated signal transduction histidine kinase (bacteriophytochrome)
LLRTDKRVVWARLACSLTRSAAGEPSGVLLQLLEITAPNAAPETDEFLAGEMETRTRAQMMRLNAELEERVRQRTSQLQLANRELEAFSYSIAHDLRAPLSSIDGFSRALEQATQGSLGEPNQHYLRRIRAGVKQMAELTDGLLALSSLSRGDLLHEEVDLAHLARSVVGQLSEQKSGRDVEVRIESPLPVIGDPRLLHQVMANLVGNAWKFTSRTRQARIDIGALWRKRGAAFYVRDNGAGFDLAHASRLFQAFHRMHTSSEFEGNGIGLAIVQKIVLRHGGLVWAESEPGNGATFYFTLAPDIPVGP